MLSILAPIVVMLLIPYYQVTKTVEDKLFIARTSRASTIVYTHGREAFAFTTAPIVERTGMEDELRDYYRKFFELRGIDSVRLLNGGTVKNGLLKAGDYSILVVNDNEIDSLSAETDYSQRLSAKPGKKPQRFLGGQPPDMGRLAGLRR